MTVLMQAHEIKRANVIEFFCRGSSVWRLGLWTYSDEIKSFSLELRSVLQFTLIRVDMQHPLQGISHKLQSCSCTVQYIIYILFLVVSQLFVVVSLSFSLSFQCIWRRVVRPDRGERFLHWKRCQYTHQTSTRCC